MDGNRQAFSPAEVGKILGVSRDTILRRIKDKSIVPVKFGRRILIPRSEIEHILRGPNLPGGEARNER